jgi:hypothetical protein
MVRRTRRRPEAALTRRFANLPPRHWLAKVDDPGCPASPARPRTPPLGFRMHHAAPFLLLERSLWGVCQVSHAACVVSYPVYAFKPMGDFPVPRCASVTPKLLGEPGTLL